MIYDNFIALIFAQLMFTLFTTQTSNKPHETRRSSQQHPPLHHPYFSQASCFISAGNKILQIHHLNNLYLPCTGTG